MAKSTASFSERDKGAVYLNERITSTKTQIALSDLDRATMGHGLKNSGKSGLDTVQEMCHCVPRPISVFIKGILFSQGTLGKQLFASINLRKTSEEIKCLGYKNLC